jgi:Fur family ferric uptake transcriptional regulator
MKRFEDKLMEYGYRITKQRAELISFFSKKHRPISAQDLAKKMFSADRASVYRTLNILENLSLVTVDIINNEKLYCSSEKPYHYIVCKKCGYTETIKCDHHFSKHQNFKNVQHRLTLRGICYKCS